MGYSMKFIKYKNAYTSAFCFECDREKNTECIRVKQNLPCGDCKGTTNVKFAKTFTKND